jgi:hypothetical protein
MTGVFQLMIKLWLNFDEGGNLVCFCNYNDKDKNCKLKCKEYVVNCIEIDRTKEENNYNSNKVITEVEKLTKHLVDIGKYLK